MTKSKKPFISIVIPTKNRHESLGYTIRTILEQDFDDYEIVVCDNNSSCETKKVVDDLKSSSIKYIRSDIDLSMSENWNLALSWATGEYITVIADNDGFIDGSLSFIKEFIEINNFPELIQLQKNIYYWPSAKIFGIDNQVGLYSKVGAKCMNGLNVIKQSLKYQNGYLELPMIYSAIVSYKLLDKIKYKEKFIHGYIPDVYTGFALAYVSKQFIKIETPLIIAGFTAASNGRSSVLADKKNIFKTFKEDSEKSSIKLHKFTPSAHSLSSNIYDSFLQANDIYNIKEIKIDRKKILNYMLSDLKCWDQTTLDDELEKIKKSCEDDKELLEIFNSFISRGLPKVSKPELLKKSVGFLHKSKFLFLDGYSFNVANILEASKFMSKFYNYESLNKYPYLSSSFKDIKKDAKIAIWGNGAAGKKLQKKLSKRQDVEILYIVDSFKEDKNAKPMIVKPEDIKDDIDYLIIASMFVSDIQNTIKNLQISKNIQIFIYSYCDKKWSYTL